MGDLAGSRGCISCCHSETTRCRDPGRANSPLPGAAGLRWLAGPLVEFSSWPEVPTADLGRSEEGSVNLAAALQVWQTRDFSSASRSAKLKMCLARNPPLIFIFLVNLIHMLLIYFYLTHHVGLGATMMKGTVLISKKVF